MRAGTTGEITTLLLDRNQRVHRLKGILNTGRHEDRDLAVIPQLDQVGQRAESTGALARGITPQPDTTGTGRQSGK